MKSNRKGQNEQQGSEVRRGGRADEETKKIGKTRKERKKQEIEKGQKRNK